MSPAACRTDGLRARTRRRRPQCFRSSEPSASNRIARMATAVLVISFRAATALVAPLNRFPVTTSLQSDVIGPSEIVPRARASEEIVLRPMAPKLVTFDAEGTLIQLTAPRGLQYREALLRANNYYVRLPGPQAFEDAFKETYAAAERTSPCYGCGRGISSRQWWFDVMQQMYARVCETYGLPLELLTDVQEELFDDLYSEVFAGAEAWQLTRNCGVVLERLAQQRAIGQGPIMGVLSNADERLVTIFDNLGILNYFDFIITSREIGSEKPSRQMFDVALTRAGITVPREALHCGNDFALDVRAAKDAGWQACHVKAPPFEEHDFDVRNTFSVAGMAGVLPLLGFPALVGPITTTRPRGQFVDGD